MISVFAQIEGLREDPIPPFSGTGGALGFGAVFQMLLALAIVLLIVKWVVPKYLGKWMNSKVQTANSDLLIEEAASVQGGKILLVKARGRSLLIGAAQNSITTLADLTEEPEYLHVPSETPEESAPPHDFDRVLERLKKLQG